MDTKSAKKGSLADAPSADADIARAEHSLSQQPTLKGLSSALPEDVSPAARETPDKREASGTLPKLNADRQSAEPAADARLGDDDEDGLMFSWSRFFPIFSKLSTVRDV